MLLIPNVQPTPLENTPAISHSRTNNTKLNEHLPFTSNCCFNQKSHKHTLSFQLFDSISSIFAAQQFASFASPYFFSSFKCFVDRHFNSPQLKIQRERDTMYSKTALYFLFERQLFPISFNGTPECVSSAACCGIFLSNKNPIRTFVQFNLKKSNKKVSFLPKLFSRAENRPERTAKFCFQKRVSNYAKNFKRENKIMKNLKRIFFRFAETVVKEEKSVTKNKEY